MTGVWCLHLSSQPGVPTELEGEDRWKEIRKEMKRAESRKEEERRGEEREENRLREWKETSDRE